MIKMFSLYKSYMIRPTLYKCVSKSVIMVTLILLWDRYVNHGVLAVWRDGCFSAALFLFALAWVSYLQLDGVRNPLRGNAKEKKKTRRHTGDIADYADEHIVSFDELDDDERTACSMGSSLLAGLLFLIPSLVALLL